MAKCSSRIGGGSMALDRHSGGGVGGGGGGQFKIWSSFSGASFRRMILDTMRCGGGSGGGGGGGGGKKHASHHVKKSNVIEEEREEENRGETEEEKPALGESLRSELKREKLSELLSVPERSDMEGEEKANEEARDVKMKIEALENFKKVVNGLGCGDAVLEAAMEVRRLTKDNSEARTTLALLGAIPPLVALLEAEAEAVAVAVESSYQIAALYALLNLSINNDV